MIIDGRKVKEELLSELKGKVKDLNLSLAVIQIGNDEASNIYIKQKEKMCLELNISFRYYHFEENDNTEDVEDLIIKLNNEDVTGVLLQLPIPIRFNKVKLQNLINYQKDVDGLSMENVYRLINNDDCLVPCTVRGIKKLLDYYNLDVNGKNVVIIGRSNLVGKPLANLLLNMDATVTVCHSKTIDLEDIIMKADIVISATGKKHLVKNVKDGAVVIDVGITREDGILYGDVLFDAIKEKVSYITPVPGGVGPMTIGCLALNIYEAYLMQNKNSRE